MDLHNSLDIQGTTSKAHHNNVLTEQTAKESELIQDRVAKKKSGQGESAKRHHQVVSQLSSVIKRPNKVQFDLNVNKTTTAVPQSYQKISTTMPPLDNNKTAQRAASNNSCTGGSSDAKKAAGKSANTSLHTPIPKTNASIFATSAKTMQMSTGVRINALDAIKKPQTSLHNKHYTVFSPSNSSRVSTKIQLAADAMRNCAATP